MKLAQQNETLINKIQEQLADLKSHVNSELQRVDGESESTRADYEARFVMIAERIEQSKVNQDILDQLKEVKKMEESQNYVIKDCHDKVKQMGSRIVNLERTDFEDKFNHITRRMIADVVRDLLTPIELAMNIDVKSMKRSQDEQASTMDLIN